MNAIGNYFVVTSSCHLSRVQTAAIIQRNAPAFLEHTLLALVSLYISLGTTYSIRPSPGCDYFASTLTISAAPHLIRTGRCSDQSVVLTCWSMVEQPRSLLGRSLGAASGADYEQM